MGIHETQKLHIRHKETGLKTRLALSAGLLAAAICTGAAAQDYKPFPGEMTDSRTLAIQERVEELYVGGNFKRAYLVLRKCL